MWAFRGEQAEVPITGQNAKRVLFGAINFRTGHRVVLRRSQMRQADFQEFLRLLRRRYGGRPLYLLLGKAPCHDTPGGRALAARPGVEVVWVAQQGSGLNPVGPLWKAGEGRVS